MSTPIYLDYAAATPLDERVFAAMRPFMSEQFYNPSAAYMAARQVRVALDDARHQLAISIGGKRDSIILTAGATESINLAFRGLLGPGDHVVIGATEHPAVRAAAALYEFTEANSDPRGMVQPETVAKCITDRTKLISVTAADSELGTIQPLRKIAQVIEAVRLDRQSRGIQVPLYFHSDASQAAGLLDLHVARLGVDLLTLNAAKCYGPKQVGLLWITPSLALRPLIVGGGQERGLRSGTENGAGAVGFSLALQLAMKKRHSETTRLAGLRDLLQTKLETALPDILINGSKKRLPGHLNVSIIGLDAERAVFRLDQNGVQVATGAACAANKQTRSHILMATGMSAAQADGSLRISLGRQTTKEDIDRAAELMVAAITAEQGL